MNTCNWHNKKEDYKLLLRRMETDMRKLGLAEYFNPTEFVRFVFDHHNKVHLPSEQELIYYMKDFMADALLSKLTETEKD